MDEQSSRALSLEEASATLGAGDNHYRTFVGPPERYDLMGAAQFSLLFLLGLRETHSLLDFGCGSLRLGRLAIPYLRPGNYFGIEPEAWLVEDGFARELGQDSLALKRPRFDNNREYRADVFDRDFDFIIAQSVFSHTGQDATLTALKSLSSKLSPSGLIVANWFVAAEEGAFLPEDSAWVYPDCVPFTLERLVALVQGLGLHIRHCPWPHAGRLTWFVIARDEMALPSEEQLAPLGVRPLVRT